MIEFAFFDLVPTGKLDEIIYFLPDEQPYDLNFQMLGFESRLLVKNVGFPLWVIWGHCTLIVIFILTYPVKFLRRRIGNYLFWSNLVRLFAEVFFELGLLAVLNLMIVDWSNTFDAVSFSNIISVVSVASIPCIFLTLVCFYMCRRDHWATDEF